jgi:hydroxymethylbilane synthase
VTVRGMILKPDGTQMHETTRDGPLGDAASVGAEAGRDLKSRASADYFT